VIEEAAGLNDAVISSKNDIESPNKVDDSIRDVISEIHPRRMRSNHNERVRSKSPKRR